MKAAIIGVTGYGGLELVRLLSSHPLLEIYSIHSSSQTEQNISDVYPYLQNYPIQELESIDYSKIAETVDIVFTSTPSGVSSTIIPQLLETDVKIIDLSGDYRLKDLRMYEEWYKHTPPLSKDVDKAVYGLAEWNKEEIKYSHFISNPGCYPTATLLGLAPLVQNQIVQESSIIIDAKSGVSGAGKSLSRATHFSETNENLKIYKVNKHQHIPEIEQVLKGWNEDIPYVTFSTHLVPMTRGIMATIYANVKTNTSTEELVDLYKHSYEDSNFVRIRPVGSFPSTKEVYGTNYCDIGLSYDERTGRITIVSVIDNLVKGAAGQAIQNANLMFGWDETLGLKQVPLFI